MNKNQKNEFELLYQTIKEKKRETQCSTEQI